MFLGKKYDIFKNLEFNLRAYRYGGDFEILKWKYQKDSQIDCSELVTRSY